MGFNIAIDGPAGAGKSTIAKMIAKELQFIYVDTGAMYRSMALYFLNNSIDIKNMDEIKKACLTADISIVYKNGEQRVLLNGEDVSDFIRTEEVGNYASITSAIPEVRVQLVALQKKLALQNDVVMDGRDIGTCVLPDAELKIYLTASSATRANRRYLEYQKKGISADIVEIEKDIIQRDKQDMERKISPLKQADDAVLVDSSYMTIEEVVNKIIQLYKEKL